MQLQISGLVLHAQVVMRDIMFDAQVMLSRLALRHQRCQWNPVRSFFP